MNRDKLIERRAVLVDSLESRENHARSLLTVTNNGEYFVRDHNKYSDAYKLVQATKDSIGSIDARLTEESILANNLEGEVYTTSTEQPINQEPQTTSKGFFGNTIGLTLGSALVIAGVYYLGIRRISSKIKGQSEEVHKSETLEQTETVPQAVRTAILLLANNAERFNAREAHELAYDRVRRKTPGNIQLDQGVTTNHLTKMVDARELRITEIDGQIWYQESSS